MFEIASGDLINSSALERCASPLPNQFDHQDLDLVYRLLSEGMDGFPWETSSSPSWWKLGGAAVSCAVAAAAIFYWFRSGQTAKPPIHANTVQGTTIAMVDKYVKTKAQLNM